MAIASNTEEVYSERNTLEYFGILIDPTESLLDTIFDALAKLRENRTDDALQQAVKQQLHQRAELIQQIVTDTNARTSTLNDCITIGKEEKLNMDDFRTEIQKRVDTSIALQADIMTELALEQTGLKDPGYYGHPNALFAISVGSIPSST